MTLDQFNNLPLAELKAALNKCCGSGNWVSGMLKKKPFASRVDLQNKADLVWATCNQEDALEAFRHHPKIGDKNSLEKKFASTKEWAGDEQRGVNQAGSDTIDRLIIANQEYLDKFGYIFIVYATGKSAAQMLQILESRLTNSPDKEIEIAKGEQHKITKLRLNKLIPMSQITTHVLDTALGHPAAGIHISLQRPAAEENKWENICTGITNSDGRIPNFLSPDEQVPPGIYRMLFETGSYFEKNNRESFYPFVPVVFEIHDTEHYHVPLLLSGFGYSTYRGS